MARAGATRPSASFGSSAILPRVKEEAHELAREAVEQEGLPILWHSNAPWAGTGYGTQTAVFGPRVARLGYRLAFSAFYGLYGSELGWVDRRTGQPFKVYPGHRDNYGNDVVGAHFQDWRRNEEDALLITLTDPWVLNWQIIGRIPAAAWVPVDHDPLMPRTEEWLFKTEAVPIAMSRFGERMIREKGLDPVYVPHGIDTGTFHPGDRAAAREIFGLPQDAFVVGMVSANKSGGIFDRKSFFEAMAGFAAFKAHCPDAVLYLHTHLQAPDGMDIMAMAEHLGVRPYTANQYAMAKGLPEEHVATLMNAFDVLLCPSRGEGFGVPLIEAQGCGTPCVVTDWSAMPEVAPEAAGNLVVEGQATWTAFNSIQITPSIEHIATQLEFLYGEGSADAKARRASVAEWAAKEYDADYITQTYWKPVLDECFDRMRWLKRRMAKASAS